MIKNNTIELQEILQKVQSLPRNQILQENKNIIPSINTQIVIPDGGYDALSKVTVQGDEHLLPENIKNGVDIFGVIGTLKTEQEMSLMSLKPEGNNSIVAHNDINFIFNNFYSETLIYFYYLDNQEIIFNPQNISINLNNITLSSTANSLILVIGQNLILEASELPYYYIGQNNELQNMYLIGAINTGTIIFQNSF